MRSPIAPTSRGGFSLVEILVALAILAILVTASVTTFRGLNEKYRVETETKQAFTDLMQARSRAMQRNRIVFVTLSGTGYTTNEDTNPAPDGNGTLETAADNTAARKTGLHAIVTDLPASPAWFEFDRNGIASVTGYLRFTSTVPADYDCITVRPTKIKMGQFTGGVCVEK